MTKRDIDITQRNWHPTPLVGSIVLVTTVDTDGNLNIAPKSWVSLVSANPFRVIIGCNHTHHTAINLLSTKECVLNFPSDDIVKKTWDAHHYLEPCKEEATLRGFSTLPSKIVTPSRLVECRAHIECRFETVHSFGEECILIVEVVAASVDEEAFAYEDIYNYLRPIFFIEPKVYGIIEKSHSV